MPKALVTGAGVRVGKSIARALAGAGYDLVLHAHRSTSELHELAKELPVHTELANADLTTEEGVATLAQAVSGPLDLLVHNAAVYERVPFRDLSRAAYRHMLALDLDAPFFLTQALLSRLTAAKSPAVVMITDASLAKPYPGYAHYFVAKAGLAMLVKALALELAPHVRVNGVAPGAVAFPERFDAAARARVLERVPLEREGHPDDVARAVLFLAREPYVTGQILPVDGGLALT